MKVQEIRSQSVTELKALLLEKRREQFNLQMQRGTGQLSRSHLLGATRRDIAKIKTVITEKTKLESEQA